MRAGRAAATQPLGRGGDAAETRWPRGDAAATRRRRGGETRGTEIIL